MPQFDHHSDKAVDGRLLVGSIRKARQINGNLDWKCGSCGKVNFARNVVCINCGKSVDKYTEYLDGSEKQVRYVSIGVCVYACGRVYGRTV